MMKSTCRKKAVQKNLENIMAKMKEKRMKLASGAAPGRARCRGVNQSSVTQTSHTIQKGLQVNNKALAEALQAEKENVRQAKVVIQHLQQQRHVLLEQVLLLRRKLKEQEAKEACRAAEPEPAISQLKRLVAPERRQRGGSTINPPVKCVASPVQAASESPEQNLRCSPVHQLVLPPTVTVRRRRSSSSRRRSDRLQERGMLSELDQVPASPVQTDPSQEERLAHEEVRHSTPEATPPRKTQLRAGRKPANQQPCGKPEPPAKKQERGQRPKVGPLKKPWENSKTRARSKSRDRSATRARAAPAAQSHKANTSPGFSDNFDFDCEESVHVTPFRSKAEENSAASGTASPQRAETPRSERRDSPSSPSSQSEDSLYIPTRRQRRSSAGQTRAAATRRGRTSTAARGKENLPSNGPVSASA